jgi:hypothetical protein
MRCVLAEMLRQLSALVRGEDEQRGFHEVRQVGGTPSGHMRVRVARSREVLGVERLAPNASPNA